MMAVDLWVSTLLQLAAVSCLFPIALSFGSQEWCRYKLYDHVRTWRDAKAICELDNKTLVHITDQVQYDFLMTLLETQITSMYNFPPSAPMWIGLYNLPNASPIWQDDCSHLDSTYDLGIGGPFDREMCYALNFHETLIEAAQCVRSKPFVCEAQSVDINTCYGLHTSSTISNVVVQMSPVYPATPVPADCYSHCDECCCIGFLYDYKNRCSLLRYGPTVTKDLTADDPIYTKVLLERSNIEDVLSTVELMSDICPFTSIPKPEISTTVLPNPITSSSTALSSATTQGLMPSTEVEFIPSEAVSTPSLPTTTTPKHNIPTSSEESSLRTALQDLYNSVTGIDGTERSRLAGSSEALQQIVQDNPDGICEYLETVIQIENTITDKLADSSGEELATMTTFKSHLLIMDQLFGFQGHTGCQQNTSLTKLVDLEDAVINTAKLFLSLEYANTTFNTSSISVLLTIQNGSELQSQYTTPYGRVIAQHPEAVRRELTNQKVLSTVISYKESPFFTMNSDPVNLPVVTTGLFTDDGMAVQNYPFIIGIPALSGGDVTNSMMAMIPNGTQYMAAFPGGFFNSSSLIVYIDMSMMESCRIYVKYGTSSPTSKDFDIYLYTYGQSLVSEYRPFGLSYSYSDGILQTPIVQTPVVFITECQEMSHKRRKRASVPTNNGTNGGPLIGVLQVDAQVIDRATDKWSNAKLAVGKLSEITLESYFFGTFSANIELLAPDLIDFSTVFLNFSDKLADTPYVLATILSVMGVLLLVTPILYRKDINDSALWSYQSLADNKTDSRFCYYICVSTGVRSQRQMKCPVFINIIGISAETGPRILTGSSRQNFTNGTSSHFCLTTDACLGNILIAKIWLGEIDQSPSWYLKSLLILDGQTCNVVQLKCDNWLSKEKDTGQTWRTLRVSRSKDQIHSLSEVSANNIFDDHLWFSLIFRPRYSRFTRVQRLWSIVSLLFLSMVASAMFYNTPGDDTNPLISIAGFEIGFKEIYTGLMSSAITVVPCLIMTQIFKNRKKRGEEEIVIFFDGSTLRPSGVLPWWTIFIAYFALITCISCGSFFTFLYSLEWGPNLTLKWMASFFLGITESVIGIEPAKAVVLAVILVFICSSRAHQRDYIIPPTSLKLHQADRAYADHSEITYPECPCDGLETAVEKRRRHLLRMDRKLNSFMRRLTMGLMYVAMLLVICSHQKVTDVFGQNVYLKNTLQSTTEIRTKDDAWQYIVTVVLPRLSPTEFYNADVKPYSELRYVGANYRMGPIRLRQTRVRGNCNVPFVMKAADIPCIPDFDKCTEDTDDYVEGWISTNISSEDITSPYRYHHGSAMETPSHIGHFGLYGGGGYIVDLDFEPTTAIKVLNSLQENSWLDERTRALFIEACVVNRNNMLFTQIQIVFEFPSVGGTHTEYGVSSANLYPYREASDFVVLAVQLIFSMTILVRIVLFFVKIMRARCRSLVTFRQWVDLFDLSVSVTAIVCLVMRVTSTVDILNTLRQEIGFYSTFGYIFQWNDYYSICLGIITGIAILNLLQHLSFNYHFYLMYRTIMAFRSDLFQFSTLLTLLMIGFSCFIYLMYGNVEGGFKTVPVGILTLFRMTIGMIKFRNDLELEALGITAILSLYAFAVTMVYINMFTSALNFGISNLKSLIAQGKTSFDWDLSRHFWDRLRGLLFCRSNRLHSSHVEASDEPQQIQESRTDNYKWQSEHSVDKFLSNLVGQLKHDAKQEKEFLKAALLPSRHYAGQNFMWSSRRNILNGVQYRYSNDWIEGDNSLVLEFISEEIDCKIDVECIQEKTADQRGLITYGQSTQPLSPFFILYTQNYEIGQCKVKFKLDSSQLSSKPVFMVTATGDVTRWEQHATQQDASTGETNMYVSATLQTLPRFLIVVNSDTWCGVQHGMQRNRLNEYVLSKKKSILQPGCHKNIFISFPDNSVMAETVIKTMMEESDGLPTVHILASENVSGPILIDYVRKRDSDQFSQETFMDSQTLTKTGDLEWRRDTKGDHVELVSLEAGVKVAVTVCLSDYKLAFAESSNRHLEHERKTLMDIYKGNIATKHWRQIGKTIGLSQQKLEYINNTKPRSMEEKTCLVLGHWLKKTPGGNLNEIKHVWIAET